MPGHEADTEIYTAYSSLGSILGQKEQWIAAEECYRTCWAGQNRLLGPDSDEAFAAIISIGDMQTKLQKFSEAEATFRDATEIRVRVLGAKHERVPLALQ
jgi:hypothetical protein